MQQRIQHREYSTENTAQRIKKGRKRKRKKKKKEEKKSFFTLPHEFEQFVLTKIPPKYSQTKLKDHSQVRHPLRVERKHNIDVQEGCRDHHGLIHAMVRKLYKIKKF